MGLIIQYLLYNMIIITYTEGMTQNYIFSNDINELLTQSHVFLYTI